MAGMDWMEYEVDISDGVVTVWSHKVANPIEVSVISDECIMLRHPQTGEIVGKRIPCPVEKSDREIGESAAMAFGCGVSGPLAAIRHKLGSLSLKRTIAEAVKLRTLPIETIGAETYPPDTSALKPI